MKKVFVYYCQVCKETFEKVFSNSQEHCNCPACGTKSKLDYSYEEE